MKENLLQKSKKTLATVFGISRRIPLIDFKEINRTTNIKYYASLLHTMSNEVKQEIQGIFSLRFPLIHDISTEHLVTR